MAGRDFLKPELLLLPPLEEDMATRGEETLGGEAPGGGNRRAEREIGRWAAAATTPPGRDSSRESRVYTDGLD